jgi:hypothetical protein
MCSLLAYHSTLVAKSFLSLGFYTSLDINAGAPSRKHTSEYLKLLVVYKAGPFITITCEVHIHFGS